MSLKTVSLETVNTFNQTKGVSASYLQDTRHAQVTDRFQVIQPASVGAALADHGFNLVACITGKGRDADKLDFQRTISRYRSNDLFAVEGLSLDIIYISKHLGRGCDELRLGFFRGVCANQWNVGTLFNLIKFRHTGNPLQDIQEGIAAILAQRGKLIEQIKAMQAKTLTIPEIEALAKRYAEIRLADKDNVVRVDFKKLAIVRREADAAIDLFTVANVLQENVVRYPLPYSIDAVDGQGNPYVRNMTTRRLRDSSSQLVDLNGKLFDEAMKLVA
jgi:Domain of unknown function (DUF932)